MMMMMSEYRQLSSPYQENTSTDCRYEVMQYPPAFDSTYTHMTPVFDTSVEWAKCYQKGLIIGRVSYLIYVSM